MGGSSGGHKHTLQTNTQTVRYAGYIEGAHSNFLNAVAGYRTDLTDESPFGGYESIDINDAFFGAGYLISSFPALYDMYGKFMAGLDVDSLYNQLFEDTINSSEVSNLITAEASLLEDEIDSTVIPRMQTGMRDINSVISSSFVVGKTLIEDSRVKALAKFSAELKYKLIPVVLDRWKTHLEWNKTVTTIYAEIMKLYFSAKMDIDEANYGFAAKHSLWPFTVLDFERAALGAIGGAMSSTGSSSGGVAGASQTQKAIGGAMSGAATGAMIGSYSANPYGVAIGAVVGAVVGGAASYL